MVASNVGAAINLVNWVMVFGEINSILWMWSISMSR
jgi:hypothetical protein